MTRVLFLFHKLFPNFLIFLFSSFSLLSAEYSRHLGNYSVEQGLSQSYVNQTIQDDRGYLWIATDYGLNRFDGYHVERITGPHDVFKNDGIRFLLLLEDSKLLVSTYYSGAFLVDTDSLAAEQIYDGRSFSRDQSYIGIEYALEDDKGMFLTAGDKLIRYDSTTQSFNTLFSLDKPEELIRTLFRRGEYIYLGSTVGLYVYHIVTGGTSLTPHLPFGVKSNFNNNNIKYLAWDSIFGLLIGTVEGLYAKNMDEYNQHPYTLIEKHNIWGLVRNSDNFYVATEQGLLQFDPITRDITLLAKFSERFPLVTKDTVRNIYQDKSGLLWLASESNGVFYWNPGVKQFDNISKLSGYKLSSPYVTDYLELRPDIIWAGTENGLNRIDLKTKNVKQFYTNDDLKQVVGKHYFQQLFVHDKTHLWLYHDFHLTLFDTVSESEVPAGLSKATLKEVERLAPIELTKLGENKFVFVTEQGHFLLDVERDELVSIEQLDKRFDLENAVGFLPVNNHDDLSFYVRGGAFYLYNHVEGTYELIYKIANYQSQDFNYVTSVLIDSSGDLWLAINGYGLVQLNSNYEVVKKLTYKNARTRRDLVQLTVWAISL